MAASESLRARYVPISELPSTPLQQGAIVIIFLMTALSVFIWALRFYYRFSKKQIGLDDWLVTIAMVGSRLYPSKRRSLRRTTVFKYGYIGFPATYVPPTIEIEPVLYYNWIMQVLYNPILALVKSSILFFLLRLGGHRRSIRYSIYALNAFNIALMIAIFLTVIFQTIPIQAYWDLSLKPSRQINGANFYISTAIITIVTDFLVLLIPFWVFVGLKMRMAAKVGLIVVFLAGGLVTIVGILRVIELYKMYYKPGYNSRESLSGTLSSIEVNLAIIACCGPALRPLFRKMFPRPFSGRTTNEAGVYKSQSKYGNGTGGVGSFHLKDMSRTRTQTEIRGYTPNGSEEEIMTYNGILRTTAVDIKYDDALSTDKSMQEDG
ncbi:unnamed protein product, partial [Fusarium equiseti]